ncbi:type VII secretion protein EccCb [Streptomyces mexicanus]|uniref:type VII secretion protein EccCb n=1 Tax=Streptomyces mexicanus TaxID=178566 RepID=UPI0031E950ED
MAGRRIALLIATDGYDDPGLNQLRTPARGATDLQALLQDPAIGRFDHVRTLLNRPKAEIEAAVEDLLMDRAPDDLVLLYLACHGIRTDTDRLYFATLGTRLARPGTTAIPARFLHEHLDDCQAGAKVVLLDCCYSGLFHRGAPMSPALIDLDEALGGRGTYVITASTALEYAYDGSQLALDNAQTAPRFTAAVIEGLSTGLADQNHDGVITPDELYSYVHDTVVDQAGPGQTPTKSGQCEGTVVLAYAPDKDISAGPAGQAAASHALPLGALLPPPVETTDRGFVCDAWEGSSQLFVPIGRLEHAAGGGTMCLDLAGRDGNVAAVGKLGSGKTTLLRSLVLSLALTHSPDEVEFLLLEGAVNRLGVLRTLPHVRGVASPDEEAAVRTALDEVRHAIDLRRRLFREHDIDSVEAFRTLRAEGALHGGGFGDLFVVVDGWMDFCWELPWFADTVHRLGNTGLHYGIHLCAATRRWSDFSPDLLGLLGTRLELALDDPQESSVDATLAAGVGLGWALARRSRFRVAVPRLDEVTGEAAARRSLADTVARVRTAWRELPADTTPGRPAPWVSFARTLGIDDDLHDLDRQALRRSVEGLSAPLGLSDTGRPLVLNVDEAAFGGMGPHGLLVGAAGSGKSELLRTLVLSFAVHHAPDALNFLLVAADDSHTFRDVADLPHVSAVVCGDRLPHTPLQPGRSAHLDRLLEALQGELVRRDALLRDHKQATARDYHRVRADHGALEPLPTLLVVFEDFTGLLAAKPDAFDLLMRIARTGRALGVHMLLGARRLAEGTLRGLATHLSYRIALRTSTAEESRAVLGVPDANRLPRDPGVGFLRFGADAPLRFTAAYVSAPYGPGGARPADGDRSVLEVVADRLADDRPTAYRVVPPPLRGPVLLGEVLSAAQDLPADRLRVPVGFADKPFEHRRDLFALDFSEQGAHAVVIGRPGSGKTTLLTTLISAFALTHSPQDVQFYVLDLTGGLAGLAGLPHVGGVAGLTDPERVRRTVAEVSAVMEARERRGDREDPWGDVFLVVDGITALRSDHESLERAVEDIARRGRRVGVHLVVTASRQLDLRLALRAQFGTVVELRLTDPMDSLLDRRRADEVPEDAPGHGLSPDKAPVLTALPRLAASDVTAAVALADLVAEARARWAEQRPAPQVRMLPALLSPAELPALGDRPGEVLRIGLGETDLAPVDVDFDADPLFLALGEVESGKSSFLRLVGRQVVERCTRQEALLMVADYRRALLGAFPEEHLLGYATSGVQLTSMVQELAQALTRRIPGPDVTAEELRTRGWYTGPNVYLLVDDYDLVAVASGNPLAPLLELLPYARDIGLRVIVARTTAGASRAVYEPFLTRIRELSTHGLILSGDPAEGPLLGYAKARREPPGRGTLVSPRHGDRRIQLAYAAPE